MIRITDSIAIDERDIAESFVRASGPGGQNVNKVSTAVELRFNVQAALFPDDMKDRLRILAGRLLTQDGILVVTSQQFRSQDRNREDALAKLVLLLRKAAVRPRKRIKTRPTKASAKRRLDTKARHAHTKKLRGKRMADE